MVVDFVFPFFLINVSGFKFCLALCWCVRGISFLRRNPPSASDSFLELRIFLYNLDPPLDGVEPRLACSPQEQPQSWPQPLLSKAFIPLRPCDKAKPGCCYRCFQAFHRPSEFFHLNSDMGLTEEGSVGGRNNLHLATR